MRGRVPGPHAPVVARDAAAGAITTAGKTLRGLRVAEVVQQDISLGEDGAITYRTKIRLSFKYESEA